MAMYLQFCIECTTVIWIAAAVGEKLGVEAARLFMRSGTARLARACRCNTDQPETQSRPRRDYQVLLQSAFGCGCMGLLQGLLLEGRISREPIMVARAHWDALPSQILLARERPTHGSALRLARALRPGERQLRIL